MLHLNGVEKRYGKTHSEDVPSVQQNFPPPPPTPQKGRGEQGGRCVGGIFFSIRKLFLKRRDFNGDLQGENVDLSTCN